MEVANVTGTLHMCIGCGVTVEKAAFLLHRLLTYHDTHTHRYTRSCRHKECFSAYKHDKKCFAALSNLATHDRLVPTSPTRTYTLHPAIINVLAGRRYSEPSTARVSPSVQANCAVEWWRNCRARWVLALLASGRAGVDLTEDRPANRCRFVKRLFRPAKRVRPDHGRKTFASGDEGESSGKTNR